MRWRWGVLAIVAFGLLGAAFFAGRQAGSDDSPPSAEVANPLQVSDGFAEIPTVKCKTAEGVRQPAAQLDPTTQVALSPSEAEGLAAYRDSAGTLLVAPEGFDCEAGIGVDGGEHVTAFPGGERNPAEYPEESGTVVSLDIARACQGCIAEAVCTLFPEAKPVSSYYGAIGEKCPEKPLREEVSYQAESTVIFSDPPKVTGTGIGSGGSDPSLGVMSYQETLGVRKVSCTLPGDQSPKCPAIVAATFAAVPLG